MPSSDEGVVTVACRLAAERGFSVFPAPLDDDFKKLSGWPDLATNDPSEVKALFAEFSGYGLGILCGERSNLTVLDVDVGEGKIGMETLARLEGELGALPPPTVRTGSGGLHYYFGYQRLAAIPKLIGVLGEGIDLLGAGPGNSFVYAPPTKRVKHAKSYRWLNDV